MGERTGPWEGMRRYGEGGYGVRCFRPLKNLKKNNNVDKEGPPPARSPARPRAHPPARAPARLVRNGLQSHLMSDVTVHVARV